MINVELLDKWIVALKSGKYQQSCSSLHDEKGFCCLGVLYDVIDSSRWVKSNNYEFYKYNDRATNLHYDIL